jgi:hypothetical protein
MQHFCSIFFFFLFFFRFSRFSEEKYQAEKNSINIDEALHKIFTGKLNMNQDRDLQFSQNFAMKVQIFSFKVNKNSERDFFIDINMDTETSDFIYKINTE